MSLSMQISTTIERLRRTSSRTKKIEILSKYRSSPMFMQILYHTYTPYLRYHIRKIPANIQGTGWGELGQGTWNLLGMLSTRKISGLAARETLFSHIKDLTPAASRILRLIVKKDLKCGIGINTINLVFPRLVPVFTCQLVEDWDADRAVWPMLASPKLDGVRGEYRAQNFFTRRGHRIGGIQHIISYIKSASLTSEFSTELYIPGMRQSRASGIIRSNMPEKLDVRCAIIDSPNHNMSTIDRYNYVSRMFWPLGTKPEPLVTYIPHEEVHNEDELDRLYHKWRSQKFEGLVAKQKYAKPKMGKSYDWMRKVDKISAEYKVINIYESEEMPGFLGGIVIEGNIRVGSGFTMEQRKLFFEKPHLILGSMVTIKAKEKTKAGSLREPVFKERRWDI